MTFTGRMRFKSKSQCIVQDAISRIFHHSRIEQAEAPSALDCTGDVFGYRNVLAGSIGSERDLRVVLSGAEASIVCLTCVSGRCTLMSAEGQPMPLAEAETLILDERLIDALTLHGKSELFVIKVPIRILATRLRASSSAALKHLSGLRRHLPKGDVAGIALTRFVPAITDILLEMDIAAVSAPQIDGFIHAVSEMVLRCCNMGRLLPILSKATVAARDVMPADAFGAR